MIKVVIGSLLILLLQLRIFSQTGTDSLNYEDSVKINLEYLLEQISDEEESQLLDFIEVEKEIGKEKIFWSFPSISVRSRMSKKLQTSRGYEIGKYLGTPLKSYQRIRLNQGKNVTAGFLAEKDPGERYINDFTNWFIQIKNLGFVTSIVFGDFVMEAGQGLILWRGYDFQKGANIEAGTIRKGKELKPYLSSDENGYLRGGAINLNLSNLNFIFFFSSKKLSASIDASNEVTSIYSAGYYRTETEIAKLKKLGERIFGARVIFNYDQNMKLGLTYSQFLFSNNMKIGGGQKYYGDNYYATGFDYRLGFEKMDIFGEASIHSNKSISGITGISINPSRTIKIVTVYRNYSDKNFTRYANPFGESYGGVNEEGYYLGVELKPVKKLIIVGYFDQFKYPGQTSINFPKKGNELFFQTDYKFLKNVLISIRYKEKISEISSKTIDLFDRDVKIIDMQIKRNYRFNVDYKLSKAIKLRSRIEYISLQTEFSKKRENGRVVYQDIQVKGTEKLTFYFRINYFKTDSFASAIYEYENDLPGVLTVPALFGRGLKWYTLINYKVLNCCDLSMKYSYLIREDVKKIGSGWDELPGNYDNRIGMQLDLNF